MTVLADSSVHAAVERFLYREAAMLDDGRFDEWVELFTDDARYEAPIRVTRDRRDQELDGTGRIFDDTKATLAIRVERLRTDQAWAEEPPSRTRHVVSNVLVEEDPGNGDLIARSNLLVYRNRGANSTYDLWSAARVDRLRVDEGELRIAHRWIALDQATMAGHNLSIFL